MSFGRRNHALRCAGVVLFLGGVGLVWGADFWNKKEPAQWSDSEIRMMTSQSPWAKQVRMENRGAGGLNTYDGSAPVGSGLPGDPQNGMRTGGVSGSSGSAAQRAPTPYQIGNPDQRDARGRSIPQQSESAIVRWESALPEISATGIPMPAAFQGHYVIGVSGFQVPRAQRPAMLETLKESATLERGTERIQPGIVDFSKDGATIFFGFARDLFPLTVADKDVQFVINTGDLRVKAKFELKAMMYKGKLAL